MFIFETINVSIPRIGYCFEFLNLSLSIPDGIFFCLFSTGVPYHNTNNSVKLSKTYDDYQKLSFFNFFLCLALLKIKNMKKYKRHSNQTFGRDECIAFTQ